MAEQTRLSVLARVQQTTLGESWNEFAAIYDDMIEGWLYRQSVQSQDADDIRQEVMTVVLRQIESFEHNGRTGAFRAWLRSITANCLRDHWKKGKRRAAGGPDLERMAAELEDDGSRQTILWNAEHDRHVLNHLLEKVAERLSQQSVKVFRRVAIEQVDADVVADELGMTLGAVRVAQHRVLKALKQEGEGLIEC